MQRTDLPPPTTLTDPDQSSGRRGVDRSEDGRRPGRLSSLRWRGARDRLDAAHDAVERRRPLFHPARGWIRRTERAASLFLTTHVFPWVPGIGVPYSRLLTRQLVLAETTIPIEGLPRAFERLRVLLITDVHAGPFLTPNALHRVFERLGRIEPELILLGGDMASASVTDIERSAAAFKLLDAPLGVFAVLGNHDHYTGDPDRLIRVLAGCGIRTLHNRSVALEREGQQLSLAGVDDLLLGAPDLPRALEQTRAPVVLLSHNPDLLFEAARHRVALMLSGHTHAGQIRLPGLPVLVRQSRFRLDQGRYRYRDTELIVSRGLGAVGIPWRLHCPPEAVLLTLVSRKKPTPRARDS
jgi:predicted MPP superfamily phosphohydrolase